MKRCDAELLMASVGSSRPSAAAQQMMAEIDLMGSTAAEESSSPLVYYGLDGKAAVVSCTTASIASLPLFRPRKNSSTTVPILCLGQSVHMPSRFQPAWLSKAPRKSAKSSVLCSATWSCRVSHFASSVGVVGACQRCLRAGAAA